MLVVDASVLVPALVDDGHDGRLVRARLLTEELAAPDLVDLEVTSVLRGLVLAGRLVADRAGEAVRDLVDLPVLRVPHRRLVFRCWEPRTNLTTYDAAYVALAEMTGSPLLTADRRIARAPGLRCRVDVVVT